MRYLKTYSLKKPEDVDELFWSDGIVFGDRKDVLHEMFKLDKANANPTKRKKKKKRS